MGTKMSSRERILTAIDCREPDHVPFLNRGVFHIDIGWLDEEMIRPFEINTSELWRR